MKTTTNRGAQAQLTGTPSTKGVCRIRVITSSTDNGGRTFVDDITTSQ